MYKAYSMELNNEINLKTDVFEKKISEIQEEYERKLAEERKGMFEEIEKIKT